MEGDIVDGGVVCADIVDGDITDVLAAEFVAAEFMAVDVVGIGVADGVGVDAGVDMVGVDIDGGIAGAQSAGQSVMLPIGGDVGRVAGPRCSVSPAGAGSLRCIVSADGGATGVRWGTGPTGRSSTLPGMSAPMTPAMSPGRRIFGCPAAMAAGSTADGVAPVSIRPTTCSERVAADRTDVAGNIGPARRPASERSRSTSAVVVVVVDVVVVVAPADTGGRTVGVSGRLAVLVRKLSEVCC